MFSIVIEFIVVKQLPQPLPTGSKHGCQLGWLRDVAEHRGLGIGDLDPVPRNACSNGGDDLGVRVSEHAQ